MLVFCVTTSDDKYTSMNSIYYWDIGNNTTQKLDQNMNDSTPQQWPFIQTINSQNAT